MLHVAQRLCGDRNVVEKFHTSYIVQVTCLVGRVEEIEESFPTIARN